MSIRKRLRSLGRYLQPFPEGGQFYVVLDDATSHAQALRDLGFSWPLIAGEQTLPPARGPSSRRNAEGEEVVHRDRPLEVAYRQQQWTWEEFRGRYDRIERSKIVDVPYKRYPRTVRAPYGVELQIRPSGRGVPIVAAGPFTKDTLGNNEVATNTVRMFVELFGECSLVDERMAVVGRPTRRMQLNWELLPPGRYPWHRAGPLLSSVVAQAAEGNQAVISARFETIANYEPDFMAIGRNGFSRYVMYGFEKRRLYVLESTEVGNATYVLREDWERVSAMTKAEILDQSAHHARLVHRESWFTQFNVLMNREGLPRH